MRHLHLSWITLWCIFDASFVVAGLRKVKREDGWKGSIPPALSLHNSFVPLKLVEVLIGNRSAFTHSPSSPSFPNSFNESGRAMSPLSPSTWTPMTGPPVNKLHEIHTSKRLPDTRPTLAALLTPPAPINVLFRPPTRLQEEDEDVLDTLSLPSVQNLVTGPLPSFVPVSATDSMESSPEDPEDELVMTLYPHPSAVKKIAVMPGNMLARIPPQVLPNVNSSVSVVHSSQVIAPKQGYFPSPMGLNTPQTIAFESANPETTPKPITATLPIPPRHQLANVEFVPFTAEDVLHPSQMSPVNTVNFSTAANYLEDQEVQGSEIRVRQESEFRPMKISSNAHQGPMPSFWADRLETSANVERDILSSGFAIDDLLRKSEDNFELSVQSVMALPLQAEDPNNKKETFRPEIYRAKSVFNEMDTKMNAPDKGDLFSPFVDESQEEDLKRKSSEEQGGVEESSATEVVPEEEFLTNGLTSEIQELERGEIDGEIAEESRANFAEVMGTSPKEGLDGGEQDNFTQEPPWTFITPSEEKTYTTPSANEREYLQQTEEKPTTELTPTTFVGTTAFFTSTVAVKFEPSVTSPAWPEIPEKVSSKGKDLVHIVVAEPGDLPKGKSKRLNNAFTKSNKLSPKGFVFTVVEGHSKVKFFGYNTLYDDSQAHYHVNKDNSFYIFPIQDSIQTLQQQKTEHTSGIRPVYFAKRPLTSLSGPFEYEQQLKKLSNNRLPPSSSAAIPDRSTSPTNSNTYQRLKGIRPYLNNKFVRNRIPWRI